MRPDQVRQIKQKEQEVPENSKSVKRMMKSLESKLIKNGQLSQFNEISIIS